MFLGILIALLIAGIFILLNNRDDPQLVMSARQMRTVVRIIGFVLILIGLCGSIGWVLEVRHIL